MNDQDFSITISVDQTPEAAFRAITNVRGWWFQNVKGGTENVGDEFLFLNGDIHRSRIRLTEVVPGERVVWRVLENYMSFVRDKTEWIGNEIRFDISRKGDKTEVRFTQVGLVPAYECFGACSKAWTFYVKESLRSLIVSGTGKPEVERETRTATAS